MGQPSPVCTGKPGATALWPSRLYQHLSEPLVGGETHVMSDFFLPECALLLLTNIHISLSLEALMLSFSTVLPSLTMSRMGDRQGL